jgi:stress response protein YsnF
MDGVYLDTQRDRVGEAGEGFPRVQTLQRRVDHPVQRADVVQLRRGPSDQRLLRPRP